MKTKYNYIIGIDPGVNTGYAVWDCKKKEIVAVSSWEIHRVMAFVKSDVHNNIFVRVEDARKRKWFGNDYKTNDAKKQNVGKVKRDCKIWEDYLTYLGVAFEMIHPIKGGTKIKAEPFKKLTGWEKQTNEHGRDAAMIVFGYK